MSRGEATAFAMKWAPCVPTGDLEAVIGRLRRVFKFGWRAAGDYGFGMTRAEAIEFVIETVLKVRADEFEHYLEEAMRGFRKGFTHSQDGGLGLSLEGARTYALTLASMAIGK